MSNQKAQSQGRPRKPMLADFPTFKILIPPKGSFSLQTDEYCLTYCSQSVAGRRTHKDPFCRSICFRKVFPHEVRNIVSFRNHEDIGPDGIAKYPLPAEGQNPRVPRLLGGSKGQAESVATESELKNWHEGWYLWTGKSIESVRKHQSLMKYDLRTQQKVDNYASGLKEVWAEYSDLLKQHPNGIPAPADGVPNRFWGPKVPPIPPPIDDTSMLVEFPPGFTPFWERLDKILSPTKRVLEITRNSIESGEQSQFAGRVWDKALSKEPFILASRSIDRAIEIWRNRGGPSDDDDKQP